MMDESRKDISVITVKKLCDGLAVPIGGQQIAGTVCRDVDAVAPIPLTGGEKR